MTLVVRASSRCVATLAFIAGAALGASPLRAQDEPHSRWELTGFGGYYFGSTLYSVAATKGIIVKARNKLTGGARLTYYLSSGFGVEASYTRITPGATLVDSAAGTEQNDGSINIDQADLDLIFAYSSPIEALYLAIGGGVTVFEPEVGGTNPANPESHDTRFAANAALGYKRWLSGPIGFRVEGRLRATRTGGSEALFSDSGGREYTYRRGVYTSGELTLGVMVGF
ncbi:MAG TPA: hypothetical protein VFW66_07910 [Gemmatimonadales bacterium]|nr:hypothetical protein [Gemmatimonadales bacterium]